MMLHKPQYGVIMLMLEAGLRVGEALGLRWEDVLWNKRALYIRRTLIRMSNQAETYVQDSPKSKTSVRKIPLSAKALVVLEKLFDRSLTKEGFVFAREDDSSLPYSYSSVEFHIKSLCKDLGISYKGMHAFRHTFATNCYNKGCNVKILSKLLGHADVSITYNIYIHLYGDALDEMRKVID
jgi:integrase